MRRSRYGSRRALSSLTLTVVLFGILAMAASAIPSRRLVWNASASVPIGLYWRIDDRPQRGDLVLAWAPLWARRLADERHYLPLDVPLAKRIAGVEGDIVCADDDAILINGTLVARRLTFDRSGRLLPHWTGCETLGPGAFFLLMPDVLESFDGRYFGTIKRQDIIGRLVPLWTR
jgi:conjugative transfer signal peptidase TraF